MDIRAEAIRAVNEASFIRNHEESDLALRGAMIRTAADLRVLVQSFEMSPEVEAEITRIGAAIGFSATTDAGTKGIVMSRAGQRAVWTPVTDVLDIIGKAQGIAWASMGTLSLSLSDEIVRLYGVGRHP